MVHRLHVLRIAEGTSAIADRLHSNSGRVERANTKKEKEKKEKKSIWPAKDLFGGL